MASGGVRVCGRGMSPHLRCRCACGCVECAPAARVCLPSHSGQRTGRPQRMQQQQRSAQRQRGLERSWLMRDWGAGEKDEEEVEEEEEEAR